MRINNNMYVQNSPVKTVSQNFCGHNCGPFRVYSYDEFINNDNPDASDLLDDSCEAPVSKEEADNLRNQFDAFSRLERLHREENERIFRGYIKPENMDITNKLMELPQYGPELLPFLVDKKKSELEYIHEMAKKRDLLGEERIPACTLPFFTEISEERLKMLEPVMLSKNDAHMWNYSPSFILDLDKCYSDKQIYIMTKLAEYKLNGMNLRQIAENPDLNHQKTIEKAKELNTLFGENLREIEFFTNRNGENWLSADIQLPHRDDKPDWQNFRRVFARLDDDVDSVKQKGDLKELNQYVDSMYSNLETKLDVFTEKDLDMAIEKVQKSNPDANEEEILRTMQKLTQFASYSCLKTLEQKFNAYDYERFYQKGGLNTIFDYFIRNKKIIALKNDNMREGVFVTKADLTNGNFEKFAGHAAKYAEYTDLVNLEGWSDGVNLLSDDNKLADCTDKILKQAKQVERDNPKFTFNDALKFVLNSDLEKTANARKLNLKTISIEAPATKEVILEQMRPIMPTKSLVKSTIESVGNYYTKDTPKEYLNICLKIGKYYDNNLRIFSKQNIVNDLKLIHDNIGKYLEDNNLSADNLYLVTPKMSRDTKSFTIINQMYSDLYGIPSDHNITMLDIKELNSYPKDSTFVTLDDIIGTGASMMEAGEYMFKARDIDDDKHVLFAAISSSKEGADYINYCIDAFERGGKDAVITLEKNTKDYTGVTENFENEGNEELNSKVYEKSGHGHYGMCTVFPYMSPDNDSALAGHLLKFFLPDNHCVKTKSAALSEIEAQTYYYDIFGTDKDHIETSAKRVYCPKEPSLLDSFINSVKNKLS